MIIFIHHSVSPARTVFFNKLSETRIPFKVYYLSSPAKNRKWKISDFDLNFPHEFLGGWKFYIPGNDHWYFQVTGNVWGRLKRDRPSLIVSSGWNFTAAYIAFLYSKLKRSKFVIWSGSTKYEPSLLRTLTLPVVKVLVRNSDSLIAYGTRARDYLGLLGVSQDKIEIAYNTVDTERFTSESRKYKDSNFIRKRYKISDNQKIVLFVGQYLRRKGVYPLLKLANSLKGDQKAFFLLIGYGPEERAMRLYIKRQGLKNVLLTGFIKNEELVKYYASCDLFILPSFEEVWGLVVNEAMCAGKPVLVSKFAGSSADLVRENKNGHIINPNNLFEMKENITDLVNSKHKREKFGRESLRMITKVNIKQNISVTKEIYRKLA